MRSNLVLSGEVRSRRQHQETSQGTGSLWAVVLAGGEGVRLRPLVRRVFGDERPKQFCPLLGPRTLLRQTLDRVGRLIPPGRTVVVGLESHEPACLAVARIPCQAARHAADRRRSEFGSVSSVTKTVNAITLATHDMALRFDRTLEFELLHGGA